MHTEGRESGLLIALAQTRDELAREAEGFAAARLTIAEMVGEKIALDAALAAARRECEGLRKLLWLRHGCPIAGLYGDDGEMQCGSATCLIDFKRMAPETIEERWTLAARAALAGQDSK